MDRPTLPPALAAGFLLVEGTVYAAFLTLDLLDRGQTDGLKYAGVLLCLALALWGRRGITALALVLTAGADWFLLVRGDHLPLGVGLFLCVQLCYLIRLRRAGAPVAAALRAGLTAALAAGLWALRLATPLNLLAGLYFAQLLSNAILAWRLPHRRAFALGLTLFVGCDLCVGLFNSGLAGPGLYRAASVGMWAFYLPSQVLIVLSAFSEKEALS